MHDRRNPRGRRGDSDAILLFLKFSRHRAFFFPISTNENFLENSRAETLVVEHRWRNLGRLVFPIYGDFRDIHWTGSIRLRTSGGALSVRSVSQLKVTLKFLNVSCWVNTKGDFLNRNRFIASSGIFSRIGSCRLLVVSVYSCLHRRSITECFKPVWWSSFNTAANRSHSYIELNVHFSHMSTVQIHRRAVLSYKVAQTEHDCT